MDDKRAVASVKLFTMTGAPLYETSTCDGLRAAVEEALSKGLSLAGVDLSDADLEGLNADGGVLPQASFKNARLARANFRGCDLKGADFGGADLSLADLSGGKLDDASFQGATLGGASLRRAHFPRACFDFAGMPWVDAVLAEGRSASFKATTLPNTNFYGADLNKTDFSQAYIHSASFEDAKLEETNFQRATFGPESVECLETSFEGAALAGANFSDIDVCAGAELNLKDSGFDAFTKGPPEWGFPESGVDSLKPK